MNKAGTLVSGAMEVFPMFAGFYSETVYFGEGLQFCLSSGGHQQSVARLDLKNEIHCRLFVCFLAGFGKPDEGDILSLRLLGAVASGINAWRMELS